MSVSFSYFPSTPHSTFFLVSFPSGEACWLLFGRSQQNDMLNGRSNDVTLGLRLEYRQVVHISSLAPCVDGRRIHHVSSFSIRQPTKNEKEKEKQR